MQIYYLTCFKILHIILDGTQPKLKKLAELFESPITEVYLYFFQHVFPHFTHLNLFLQRDEPVIYLVHDQVCNPAS